MKFRSLLIACAVIFFWQDAFSFRGVTGASCGSDYQCLSLCCNSSRGKCDKHNLSEGYRCGKLPGESCVTSEFCVTQNVSVCKVYRVSTDAFSGEPICALRCFPEEKKGECIASVCHPPERPQPESLDDIECISAPELPYYGGKDEV